MSGRMVILSFGLLGPGKGYESAIAAMPAVVQADPTALYVILGATHPELIRREGESYRHGLAGSRRVAGRRDHVRFVGRYVDSTELGLWLTAADIFVTPYPNLEQIVSGTAVVRDGRRKGHRFDPVRLRRRAPRRRTRPPVAAASTDALAEGLIELVLSSSLRRELGRRAYLHSREMLWPEVGAEYRTGLRPRRVARRRASTGRRARRRGGCSPCLTGRSTRVRRRISTR